MAALAVAAIHARLATEDARPTLTNRGESLIYPLDLGGMVRYIAELPESSALFWRKVLFHEFTALFAPQDA